MKKLFVALLAGAALTGISHGQGTTSAPPAAAAANPADVVPLEVFSHFPDLDDPAISPNGQAIATKIRFQGGQALAIVPIAAGGKPDIIAKDGQFDQQDESVMRSWRWADDDNLLITLTSRQNFMGQTFDASRLIAYNRTTKKVTRLGWEGSKFSAGRILWVSHEGPPTILLERTPDNGDTEKLNQPEVIKIDVLTGATQIVQRQSPSIDRWYADGAGVVRLGLGSDSSTGKSVAMYRSGPGANFRTVFSGREDRFDPMPLPSIFLKEPDKGIAISRKDGYGAVYEVDLNTLQLGRKLFSLPGYDIDGVGGGPDRDTLDTIYTVQHRSRNVYFNPRLKEIQQALDETFGEGNAAIVSADLKRERLIVDVAKPGMPGGYYLYDTNTGGVGLLGWVNGAIKDRVLNPVTSVRYRASDGKEIEAVLTMPRHRLGQKNLPLIVLPHGGPWARDSEDWEYVPWAQPLAELGYVVIQPNYRGSSGYGKDWEKASDGNWGERMQDDLNDAVAYLAAQGTIDPKRVCMMGWSYGGYAASRAAQRDGSKYRCAISGAGVHDLPAMVTYDKGYLGEYGAKTGLGAAGKLEAVSPGLHPKDYSTPILIIHGEHDQRVPVSQSRNLVSRLRSAGKVEGRDFEYVEIPRETHNLLLESSRMKVLEAVKAFLDKHNPA
jgi:dipeptidyl aminopeptidase/acylaminoacyl peptidase